MTGDFLDRLNREAYLAWIARWQQHNEPDAPRIYDIARTRARDFIDSLSPRHRIDIASPAYLQNQRPA